MSTNNKPRKVLSEGKPVGEFNGSPTPGSNIELKSGSQDGFDTFRSYKVESVDGEAIKVSENPLLG